MGRYAQNTKVAASQSRSEIEKILSRYGASGFAYGWEGCRATILFQMNNRRIKFVLPLPDKTGDEFRISEKGRERCGTQIDKLYDQAIRQRWRALTLAIKAKLETVESEIASFDDEFMSYIMLPNGKTVGDAMIPQLTYAYKDGKMPPLLGYDG